MERLLGGVGGGAPQNAGGLEAQTPSKEGRRGGGWGAAPRLLPPEFEPQELGQVLCLLAKGWVGVRARLGSLLRVTEQRWRFTTRG